MQAIRKYVDFNYNLNKPLTDYQKRRIKQAYDVIDPLLARPHIVARFRKPERLRAAQEFAQHEEFPRFLKVAFVPTANPDDAKLRVNWRKATPEFTVIESGGAIARTGIRFNARQLAHDPDTYIDRIVRANSDVTHYAVQAGEYEISASVSPRNLAARVKSLMIRYSEGGDGFRARRKSSNHWKQWLHGVNAYRFPKQANTAQYMDAKKQAADKLQRQRKNAKIRNNKLKGKR